MGSPEKIASLELIAKFEVQVDMRRYLPAERHKKTTPCHFRHLFSLRRP